MLHYFCFSFEKKRLVNKTIASSLRRHNNTKDQDSNVRTITVMKMESALEDYTPKKYQAT